jgi:glyoxylase-like metal-dependent hydrolase (beta-lactamase superfamily II)
MRPLVPDVWQLRGFPPNAINVYVLGDVLVDAGTRWARRRIMRQVRERTITAHALTHAHPDHQGASHAVCESVGVPLWCGAGDVDAMERLGGIARSQPPGVVNHLQDLLWTGPPHPVARPLHEGDVLVAGDVLNNMDVRTGRRGLREPLPVFTPDPVRNRESIRRLAALRPGLTLFGHGPPLRDWRTLDRFVENLA